jgi:hypothetical protein
MSWDVVWIYGRLTKVFYSSVKESSGDIDLHFNSPEMVSKQQGNRVKMLLYVVFLVF